MSWSTRTQIVAKGDADAAVAALTTGTTGPTAPMHEDQLRTAKVAACLILATIPGPFVSVSLSGHANGVGWQGKDGWANDCISISVTQSLEPQK